MAQNIPRKHHFVPAFYLSRWANSAKSELVEYSRIRGRLCSKWRHPNATGFEENLYSFKDLPEPLSQHLEVKFFKPTDDIANKVLTRILEGDLDIYEPTHRNGWSRFLFSLQLRHPDSIAELRQILPRILAASADTFEATYQEIRNSSDPPSYKEYQAAAGEQMDIRILLYMLQAAMDNELAGQRLNDLKWATLNVGKSKFRLLTSDRPLQLNADGAGLVLLPISPRVLFIAAPNLMTIKRFEDRDPTDLVTLLNRHVVGAARRYVFAADADQTRFIANRMPAADRTAKLFPNLEREMLA